MEIWHFIRIVTGMENGGCIRQRGWGRYGDWDRVGNGNGDNINEDRD